MVRFCKSSHPDANHVVHWTVVWGLVEHVGQVKGQIRKVVRCVNVRVYCAHKGLEVEGELFPRRRL